MLRTAIGACNYTHTFTYVWIQSKPRWLEMPVIRQDYCHFRMGRAGNPLYYSGDKYRVCWTSQIDVETQWTSEKFSNILQEFFFWWVTSFIFISFLAVFSSQVTFIFIMLYTIDIVSKQPHNIKLQSNRITDANM